MTIYIDTEDLKATIGIAGTDFADDDLEGAAAEASELVEDICGRTFGLGETGETRYFLPDDARLIRIDDLISATSISIDRDLDGTYEETLTVGTDVRLGPPNAPGKGEPYTSLEAINGVSLLTGGGYLKIVGQWGWQTIPATVVRETGQIASMLLKMNREAPFGFILAGDGAAAIGDITRGSKRRLKRYTIRPAIGSPRLG